MAYTFEQLSQMTVAQLREIAQGIEHEAVKGFSTMHKEKLLPALCQAMSIEAHVHHHVVGLNKAQVKAEIRELKKKRDAAITARDKKQLKAVRRRIHRLKLRMRRATV